jgi:hypothetical protein
LFELTTIPALDGLLSALVLQVLVGKIVAARNKPAPPTAAGGA